MHSLGQRTGCTIELSFNFNLVGNILFCFPLALTSAKRPLWSIFRRPHIHSPQAHACGRFVLPWDLQVR